MHGSSSWCIFKLFIEQRCLCVILFRVVTDETHFWWLGHWEKSQTFIHKEECWFWSLLPAILTLKPPSHGGEIFKAIASYRCHGRIQGCANSISFIKRYNTSCQYVLNFAKVEWYLNLFDIQDEGFWYHYLVCWLNNLDFLASIFGELYMEVGTVVWKKKKKKEMEKRNGLVTRSPTNYMIELLPSKQYGKNLRMITWGEVSKLFLFRSYTLHIPLEETELYFIFLIR